MMGMVVATCRQPGQTDSQRAALHRSMIAYSGTYRIDGNRFIVGVDLSWHLLWDGTDQGRTFELADDRLHIVSTPGPNALESSRISYGVLSWVRASVRT